MKVIIPIAGLGTRLLPFSKVIPKAMLPVHDRPAVQWIVEELEAAGIDEIIFITSKGQEMVKEYFTEESWYDEALKDREKEHLAEELERIRSLASFHFVEQEEQLGDGHAILQAKELINEEPVLVIFGDCLYLGDNMIKNCIQKFQETGNSVIAVKEISPENTHQYGIVGTKEDSSEVSTLVEKPQPEDAPSNKAIIGRYLLSPSIWKQLEKQAADSGEIRLIDALNEQLKEESIQALEVTGKWLDTGSIDGLYEASYHHREHFKEE